jgi:hypothetical protein
MTGWRPPPGRSRSSAARSARRAARRPAASRRRGHPRQGEPVGMGELPRQRAGPSPSGPVPQRLERRGGFTRDPYVLSWDPCGSSSGSGRRAGGEPLRRGGRHRDGRLGGLPQRQQRDRRDSSPRSASSPSDGIIPIAHSQDTAGPMGRTVTDVAIMLNAMVSPFGEVRGQGDPGRLPRDSSTAGRTARRPDRRRPSAVQRRHFADVTLNPVTEAALDVMRSLGATIVDPANGPDPFDFGDAEFDRPAQASSRSTSRAICAASATRRCGRSRT